MIPAPDSGIAVVTVATRNYQYRSRVLMRQVESHLPGALRIAYQTDPGDAPAQESPRPFILAHASGLNIPRYEQLAFALDPTALCCALKPWIILDALSRPGVERVLYLDNDIALYRRPDEWLTLLERHPAVLTPHLLAPLPSTAWPPETILLHYGAYNAGMIGASRRPEAIAFLSWWRDRLSDPANLEHDTGYDQAWLDFAPVFFRDIAVLRNPGYNVAFWNLAERRLECRDGLFSVNETPLTTFHFSCLDENTPSRLVASSLPCTAAEHPAALRLVRERMTALLAEGRDACLAQEYTFARFDNGEKIAAAQRRVVAEKWWRSLPADLRLFSMPELWNIHGLAEKLNLPSVTAAPLRRRILNRLRRGIGRLRRRQTRD